MKKNKPGGQREGAGRKRKFVNPITINFMAEEKDIAAAKKKFPASVDGKYNEDNLNAKFNRWLKRIILFVAIAALFSACASTKDCYNPKYSVVPKHKFRN